MKCIKCDQEARAVCQFCGRAVCKEHIQKARFVTGYTSRAGFWGSSDNAVSVEDAVWCGECHPVYQGTS
jgi:hypothetical protein